MHMKLTRRPSQRVTSEILRCPIVTLMDRSEAYVGHADKVTSDILRCPTVALMDRSEAHVGHAWAVVGRLFVVNKD